MKASQTREELNRDGFVIVPDVYSDLEVRKMITCIQQAVDGDYPFESNKDLFAIRQLIQNVPDLAGLIFNSNLQDVISLFCNSNFFLTKAIYFDKPKTSNWFVSYHQDLSISVNQKSEVEHYSNWTVKKGQMGVQPPIDILENTITIRIHLDDTDSKNGALRVIPESHRKGVIRFNSKDYESSEESICAVKRGGVMLMRPLILHASSRTTNGKQRRVIHLEFNDKNLSEPLEWLEKFIPPQTETQ